MPSSIALSHNSLRRYLHQAGSKGDAFANRDARAAAAPYALVTGATGGMGEEWAYQLAEHGFNVIIQGRNGTKLQKVKDTILKRHVRGSTSMSNGDGSFADKTQAEQDDEDEEEVARAAGGFVSLHSESRMRRRRASEQGGRMNGNAHTGAMSDPPIVEILVCEAVVWPNEALYAGLAGILEQSHVRLTVVINNLGVQSEGYPRLEDLSREEMSGIIVANSLFPAEVTRTCVPHLKRNAPSLCVTVTSLGAWTPTPYLSPYMGTKGFDVAFSHSLRSEMLCEGANVDVVCMVPGQVQSGMCLEPESLMVPTSKAWVEAAIASLRPGGLLGAVAPNVLLPTLASFSWWSRPKAVVTPWWPHYLGIKVAQWGPTWLLDSVAVRTVKDLKQKHAAGSGAH